MFKMKRNSKGFTLIELIIVVAIIAALAAIAIPMVSNYSGEAKISADAANAKVIEGILKRADAKGKDASDVTFKGLKAADLAAADLEAAIVAELSTVPAAQQTDFEFYFDKTNKTVAAKASAGANDIACDAP